jgi:hypothetical protein
MPYHSFNYRNIKQRLGIDTEWTAGLFAHVPSVTPPDTLLLALSDANRFFTQSELARREHYIAPVLKEVIRQVNFRAVLYSQVAFDVDPERHLAGEVDYLITLPPLRLVVDRPVIGIAEAKVDHLKSGYGQCIAGLVAARIHNEKEHGLQLPAMYGIVTDGLLWQGIELRAQTARLDSDILPIDRLERIMGLLVWMIEEQLRHCG